MYDYIITKPPLDEDTLTHYGVKGMRWRRRKKKNQNRTGDKSRAGVSTRSAMRQASQARTNEERAALVTSVLNRYGGSQKFRKVGNTVADNRGNVLSPKAVSTVSAGLEDVFASKQTNRRKKTRSSK